MKINFKKAHLLCGEKLLKIMMRTFLFLCFTTALSFAPNDAHSQNAKIVIDKDKEISVSRIFEIIQEQAGYKFVYSDDLIRKAPKVRLKKGIVRTKELLRKGLSPIDCTFEFTENETVIVKKRSKKNVPNVVLQVSVSGTVNDSNGQPLPGANIVEKGTTNGTQTDFDGNFTIDVLDQNAVLVISYIGYSTKEVALNGQTNLAISLDEDAAGLDEVVLIGYGTVRKSDLTGAVSSVSSEDAKALTISNPTAALQGRVAGVNVQSNGGAPGAGVSVIIRGAGTINGSVDPLYVVDGVFLENLSSVNPNDIATMEVLKDASAAAIYGSRAANGVVIITTTKGSSSKGLVINGHITGGVTTSTSKIDFLNARQYADIRNAIDDASNASRAPANSTNFNPNVDTDWQDLTFRTGILQDYGFNISNRSEQASVYLSANYFDERGVLVSSDYNRINLRLNSEFWSKNKKLKLSQSLALTQKTLNQNNDYGVNGYNFPTLPFQDTDGNFVAPSNLEHGVAFSRNRYARAVTLDDENRIDEIFGNIAGEFEFLPGLKYRLNLGLNFTSLVDYLFTPTFFWSESNASANQNLDADLRETRSTRFDALVDNVLSYNKEIGKHSINAILGSSFQKVTTRGTSVTASRFPSDDLRVLSAAEQVDLFSGEEIVTGLASLYGRLIYDYDNRYFLTGTLRRDKSSRFSEDFRTGYFPSASVGWKISNEEFFPQDGPVSSLKLRASYGELGSQNVEDYAFTPVINLNSNYDFGNQRFFGVSRTQFRLNDLVWEKSKTTNFGIDASFFDHKLQASLDYYIRDTEDILLSVAIPQTSGSRQPVVTNSAAIQNKGLELNLNYRNRDNAFKYDVNLNLTSSSNEVTSLGELDSPLVGGVFSAEQLQGTRAIVGEQLGVFWGFQTDGLYQSQAEIDNDPNLVNSPGQRAVLKPGDFVYSDTNGDGLISNEDKVNIGNPYPDFEFGVNFNAEYKNFEFDLFLQGQVGNEILNTTKYNLSFDSRSNYSTDVLNAWSPSNTDTNFPVLGNTRFDVSPFYIEDGSYLRVKQLRVAYNFKDLFNDTTDLRLFISGQNLLTITGYSGYDPEVGIPGNLLTRGVDFSAYPQNTQISLGVQFTIN
ncbi:SusC/RagA family TonB-linked outer membrane protein [Flagellimonas sp. 2504JD4-2]